MTKKSSTDEVVLGALRPRSQATVAEIAAAVKLSRSTVGRALAKLERSGKVGRSASGYEGARRLPDLWVLVRRSRRQPPAGERLRPGELDGLALGYLQKHAKDAPFGPTAVARSIGRSSGAVGNCLARLAAAGRVRQVGKHPRRYAPMRDARRR